MVQHHAEAPSFIALLEPIRDLAASWNVDVAEKLTQYAATLGINLDDEASTQQLQNTAQVDFAQAALLVQGSTSIYSRKVEHLLNLVYTAVASLSQLKSTQNSAGDDADGANANVQDDEFLADEVSFLSLDDCLPEIDTSRITLPPKQLPPPGSLQDKTCLKQIPRMLAQHGSDAAQIASAKFNLLSARVHPSGALIMPGCPPFDENLEALPEGSQRPEVEQPNETSHLEQQDSTQPTTIDFDNDDRFSTPPPMAPSEDGEEILVAVASSAKKRRSPEGSPVDKEVEPPKRDPFLLLDPHQKIPELEKELKVGKTCEIPKKACVPKPYIGVFDNGMSKMELTDALLGPLPRGTAIRSYLCFEGARDELQDILRRRNAKKRQMMARNSPTAVIFDQNREVFDDMEEEEDLNQMGMNTVTFDMDDNEEIGIPSYPDMADGPDGMEAPAIEMDNLEDTSGLLPTHEDEFHRLASSYEETCRKYLERTRGLWERHSVDAKLAKRVESWASRMRPILDEEEKRPEFDIAAYGNRIVSQFQDRCDKQGVNEISMSTMFQGFDKYDAPRATTPATSRSKRLREPGGTPLTAKRALLRLELDA